MEKNNKKVINAWCMYDWANSVYSLVITSTIFPIYYNAVTSTENKEDLDHVYFFGIKIINTVLYSYSLAASFLILALVSPLLSGIADYSNRKKRFLKFFAGLGSASCIGLYFFEGDNLEYGILCFVMANIGYAGSLVFYDAYLPKIVTADKYDRISAKGYSLGYIGGVILLILNLIMIQVPEAFGFEKGSSGPARFSFLLVGIWWILFSLIPFYYLPSSGYHPPKGESVFRKGYLELVKVFRSLKDLPILKLFLLSFFFYNSGVQTVMYLAATFGEKELKLPEGELIMTILIIQIVAVFGSYIFAFLSEKRGNKFSLITMLVIWVAICFGAYFIYNSNQFFFLAFIVGLVMGGIQALSRATYSKLIPENAIDTTSYFSFYDVTFYLSCVAGIFTYGLLEQITNNMRNGIFALALFFFVGIGFMIMVKIPLFKGYKQKVTLKATD